MREIEVASSLQHPHNRPPIEHGTHKGLVYLVTEFVSGMDPQAGEMRGGKLDYREMVRIIEQTLAALDFAHAQSFVHRDIQEQKPLGQGDFPNASTGETDGFWTVQKL